MHPSAKLSIKELRKKCRNADYAKWLHRPARLISIYITKLFLILGISANTTSVMGFILFLTAFGFFAWPDPLHRAIGIGIMLVAELFDYVDGELSRAYGNSTKTGGFLEPFFQDIIYTLIFVVVGSSVYFETQEIIFLYLGMSASFGKILFRLTEMRFQKHMSLFAVSKKEEDFLEENPAKKSSHKSFSMWTLPHRVALLLHHNFLSGMGLIGLLVIAVLVGRLDLFLYFFGLTLVVFWIALSVLRIRAIMEMDKQVTS